MLIGVLKETFPGEQRVALIPSEISRLTTIKCSVIIEAGAGDAAGFQDASYTDKGATVVNSAAEVFAKADLIVQVQGYGSDSSANPESLSQFKKGQGLIEPQSAPGSSPIRASLGSPWSSSHASLAPKAWTP